MTLEINSRVFADSIKEAVNAVVTENTNSVSYIEKLTNLVDHKNTFATKTIKGHFVPGFTMRVKDGVVYSRMSLDGLSVIVTQAQYVLNENTPIEIESSTDTLIHVFMKSALANLVSCDVYLITTNANGTTSETLIKDLSSEIIEDVIDSKSSAFIVDTDVVLNLSQLDTSTHIKIIGVDEFNNEVKTTIPIKWVTITKPYILYPEKKSVVYGTFPIQLDEVFINGVSATGTYSVTILDKNGNELYKGNISDQMGLIPEFSNYLGDITITSTFVSNTGVTSTDSIIVSYVNYFSVFQLTRDKVYVSSLDMGSNIVSGKFVTTPTLYQDGTYNRFVEIPSTSEVLTVIERSLYRSTDSGQTFSKVEDLPTTNINTLVNPKIVSNIFYVNGAITVIMSGKSSTDLDYVKQDVVISKDNGVTWEAITIPKLTFNNVEYDGLIVDLVYKNGKYHVLYGYNYTLEQYNSPHFVINELYYDQVYDLNYFYPTKRGVLNGITVLSISTFFGSIRIKSINNLELMFNVLHEYAYAGSTVDSPRFEITDQENVFYGISTDGGSNWVIPRQDVTKYVIEYAFIYGNSFYLLVVKNSIYYISKVNKLTDLDLDALTSLPIPNGNVLLNTFVADRNKLSFLSVSKDKTTLYYNQVTINNWSAVQSKSIDTTTKINECYFLMRNNYSIIIGIENDIIAFSLISKDFNQTWTKTSPIYTITI